MGQSPCCRPGRRGQQGRQGCVLVRTRGQTWCWSRPLPVPGPQNASGSQGPGLSHPCSAACCRGAGRWQTVPGWRGQRGGGGDVQALELPVVLCDWRGPGCGWRISAGNSTCAGLLLLLVDAGVIAKTHTGYIHASYPAKTQNKPNETGSDMYAGDSMYATGAKPAENAHRAQERLGNVNCCIHKHTMYENFTIYPVFRPFGRRNGGWHDRVVVVELSRYPGEATLRNRNKAVLSGLVSGHDTSLFRPAPAPENNSRPVVAGALSPQTIVANSTFVLCTRIGASRPCSLLSWAWLGATRGPSRCKPAPDPGTPTV